jgi:hypothetical protein
VRVRLWKIAAPTSQALSAAKRARVRWLNPAVSRPFIRNCSPCTATTLFTGCELDQELAQAMARLAMRSGGLGAYDASPDR